MRTVFWNKTQTILRNLRNIILRKTGIDREALASIYLEGSGIEIGALNNPLKMPRSVKVRYVDRMAVPELRKQYPELKTYKLVDVEIIDDGETLATLRDASEDFIIANHFLEHCENPIKAMINFVRVLRKGGTLFLSIPDKRYTFDRKRQVTSFNHLLQDFTQGPALSRNQHFKDWVTNSGEQLSEETIQRRVDELASRNYSIHFHVWTQKEMLEFFTLLSEQFGLPIEVHLFMKHEGEAIFIIKKQS